MKKHIILLTSAVMMLSLTGCGGMTKEKLLKEMETASEGKEISSLSMILDMDMGMSTQGITVDVGMDMDMNMKINIEEKNFYLDMNMDIEAVGETLSESAQMYMLPEDDVLVGYTHTDSTDTWEKQILSEDLSGFEEPDDKEGSGSVLSGIDKDQITLAEETQELDGTEVYVLNYTLTGEEIQKIFDESEYSNTIEDAVKDNGLEDLEGMDALVELFDFDFSSTNIYVTTYVDAETFLPVQMSMDFEGLEEVLNPILSALMTFAGEDMDLTMTIDTLNIVCKEFNYDPVDIPLLPDGAKEAAENTAVSENTSDIVFTTTAQGERYTIFENSSSIDILPLEGWIIDSVYDDAVIIYDTPDYNWMISYYVYDGYSPDYFSSYVETDLVPYYQENEYYVSHGRGDESMPFDSMWISCNDNSVLYYVWFEISDTGYLFIEIDDYSGSDMTTSINLALSMIVNNII